MAHPISQRSQLYRAISHSIEPAKRSLELSSADTETTEKVISAFNSLYNSIKTFIRYSPKAFSDISLGIGTAQDLLLYASAKLINKPKQSKQLLDWEKDLSTLRLSPAGGTHPNWLKASHIGTGVLLSWKAPSLDGCDEELPQEKKYGKERLYYDSLPPSPRHDREAAFLLDQMALDFKDKE